MLTVKRVVRGVCPPLLWALARRAAAVLRPAAPPPVHPGLQLLSTVEEIDALLERAVVVGRTSFNAQIDLLNSFRLKYPDDLPADPDSPEYRAAQMRLYEYVSGRTRYDAETCEATPFTQENIDFPFPYFTRSGREVGQNLIAAGILMRALDLPVSGRILEFGCGYGKLTTELALTGFDVTAVDVYAPFLEFVRGRCLTLGRTISTVHADMIHYEPERKFDRVIFNACFHHCSDHIRMVERLDRLVAPSGRVYFSSELIHDDFPVPWGLHPYGYALWTIRRHGWLELGFRTDYFLDLLKRHGWACEIVNYPGASLTPLFVARRR